MQCYACENEAEAQCPRCANPYCSEHGTELCARCEDPALATPSATVFRFALIGLVFASVLALWLIIRPPDLPEGSGSVVNPAPTPTLAAADDTGNEPTAIPTATIPPAETPTPAGATTPTPTAAPATDTPAPTAEPTPEPPSDIEYVVVSGDTWYGIAEAFGVDANALAAYNGTTIDEVLHVGQTLLIPQ
jgi:LysM repeat protein